MSILSKISETIWGKTEVHNEMPQFIPTPPSESPAYSDAHIQMLRESYQVDSKDSMLKLIDDSVLSLRCKEAFKGVVMNLYDTNIIFSNNSKIPNAVDIAYLEWQIDIFPVILTSSSRSDRLNPIWSEIYNLVLGQLRTRLSRTQDKDRVEILFHRHDTHSETTVTKQENK